MSIETRRSSNENEELIRLFSAFTNLELAARMRTKKIIPIDKQPIRVTTFEDTNFTQYDIDWFTSEETGLDYPRLTITKIGQDTERFTIKNEDKVTYEAGPDLNIDLDREGINGMAIRLENIYIELYTFGTTAEINVNE